MLAAVTAALLRGHGDWGRLHPVVWFHIVSIGVALILTPVMLLHARGDRRHRILGTIWLAAMASTALASYGIRSAENGGFSWIHILSTVTLIGCWRTWVTARRHRLSIRLIVGGRCYWPGSSPSSSTAYSATG